MPQTHEIEHHPQQPTQMKRIEVVAAVIFDERGRIFATQRGYGEWKDWWEFPGERSKPEKHPSKGREERNVKTDLIP